MSLSALRLPRVTPIEPQPGGSAEQLHRILIPVGASADPGSALKLARRLCDPEASEVRIVHIRIFDPPVRGCGRFYPQSKREAAAVVQNAVSQALAAGLPATGVVAEARRSLVASAIAGIAAEWGADVIVLASRPRRAVSRLLPGSVAGQLVRRAACPVLITRPDAATISQLRLAGHTFPIQARSRRHSPGTGSLATASPEVQSDVRH